MILDKIENADAYFSCVPHLEEFMNFFNNNDLETLPACKIKLQGDDLFVNILDVQGAASADSRLKAHKEYIDIQIPLTADERMGWKPQDDCQETTVAYNEQRDVEYYGDAALTQFTVPAGHFAIFFPEDAHQTGIAAGETYRKVIVKIRDNRN